MPAPSLCRFAIAGCLATVIARAAPAQDTPGDSVLVAKVTAALRPLGVPGVVWSLVMGDSTSRGAAGVRDLGSGAPMTVDTRVQLGSVTKNLVATGVLQLATRGMVDLDAPLATYLTGLPIENPWEATSPLRVRHLLDHTSGLGDAHLWQVFTDRGSPDQPLREAIARPGTRLRLQAPPGRRFSYSNTGYLILGLLIEARTGMRYEPWLDRELLAPLGMTHSTFGWVSQEGPRPDSTMAMGHFEGGIRRASYAIPTRPAVQFATTAGDMARFARFLMSNGRVDGKVLVDSALLAAMGDPTTTDAVRSGLASGYGLGLQRRERWGTLPACHLGNVGTFRAILCLYPAQQRAFFASYNSDPEGASWDRVDSLLAARLTPEPLPPPLAPSSPGLARDLPDGWYLQRPARFEQFAYLDAVGALVRISRRGDTLTMAPIGGPSRALVGAGDGLWRLTTRRLPSHAVVVDGGQAALTDGQRTLDRVASVSVWIRWMGAATGLLSLGILLVRGPLVARRAPRGRRWLQPVLWPSLGIAALLLAGAAMLRQPFLAIGDPTVASISLAAASAFLLVATGGAFLRLVAALRPAEPGDRRALFLDLALVGGLLQWLVTLVSWGLLPLRLWA